MFDGPILDRAFEELRLIAPAGYAAGLKVKFTGPALVRETYPKEWVEIYRDNLLAFTDPVVIWSLTNIGYKRWSDLEYLDVRGVMKRARLYGLNYGVAISVGKLSARSMLGMARSDREFSDTEINVALEIFGRIHEIVVAEKTLTPSMAEALRLVSEGEQHASAAAKLGISESAFKARLKSARERLNVRSTAEAITQAKQHNLL
ncbi:MAG: autoinducer binding domain-containing protein [Albidovulum sp.]